jgi:hypothetical protein
MHIAAMAHDREHLRMYAFVLLRQRSPMGKRMTSKFAVEGEKMLVGGWKW